MGQGPPRRASGDPSREVGTVLGATCGCSCLLEKRPPPQALGADLGSSPCRSPAQSCPGERLAAPREGARVTTPEQVQPRPQANLCATGPPAPAGRDAQVGGWTRGGPGLGFPGRTDKAARAGGAESGGPVSLVAADGGWGGGQGAKGNTTIDPHTWGDPLGLADILFLVLKFV